MKIFKNLLILIIPAICYFGCTHTNELAYFNLSNKNILFTQWVNPDLSSAKVVINTSYESVNPLAVILSDFGSIYTEGEIREKLQNAVDADSIIYSITEGLKNGLNTHYKINIVDNLEDEPQFIVEAKLEKFCLSSNSTGIYASVNCDVIITERKSAKTVWENTEISTIPVNYIMISFYETTLIRTAKSIINAVRLMNMSEEEIRNAINNTAKEVGKIQSERLREDIAYN
jgi:hypothetical protein